MSAGKGLVPAGPPARVLAIKLADFGDALLTTPALGALRASWPEATLDVLTTPGPAATVFAHSGLVDEVHTLEKRAYDRPLGLLGGGPALARLATALRGRRYDRVLLFHSLVTRTGALKHAALVLATGAPLRAGLRGPARWRAAFLTHPAPDRGYGAWHVVDAHLAVARAAGAGGPAGPLAFQPGTRASAAAAALLAAAPPGSGPLVALHPGCGPYSPARRWPVARFAAVGDRLAAAGARLVLVGTAADDTAALRHALAAPALDLSDRTDLPTLAAVLARMDLLLANDGGVMHLAAAMGRPVVAPFGPTDAASWGPWPVERHRTLSLALPCRPCLYVGHALGAPAGCPSRDCLAWLGPEPVLAAARELLAAGVDRGPGPAPGPLIESPP